MSDVGPRLIGKYFTPSMGDNGHLVGLLETRGDILIFTVLVTTLHFTILICKY